MTTSHTGDFAASHKHNEFLGDVLSVDLCAVPTVKRDDGRLCGEFLNNLPHVETLHECSLAGLRASKICNRESGHSAHRWPVTDGEGSHA